MEKRKRNMNKKEKKLRKETIKYNLINSAIAGGLVFCGMIAEGSVSWQGSIIALGVAGAVALNKFQDYWRQRGKKFVRTTNTLSLSFQFI